MKRFFSLLPSLWLASLLLFGLNLMAQTDSLPQATPEPAPLEAYDPDLFSLQTPQRTVSSHLRFLQEDKYDPAQSAQALFGEGLAPAERQKLAIQLKQIYDGSAYFIYVDDIPDDPNYQDSLGRARYVIMPQQPDIYVQKVDGQWVYSKKTIQLIPQIHDELFPVGSDLLVQLTPQIAQKTVLGLKVWKWEGIVIILLLSVLVYRLLDVVFTFSIKRILPMLFRKASSLDKKPIHAVARPFSLLIVMMLVQWLYPVLQLPPWFSQYVFTILKVATLFFGVLTVYRLVDLVADVADRLADKTDTALDDQLIPLLTKISKMVVVILGVIFILQNLNVNVTALLAGVSIGGLALALAAQDTVKNFIGSLSIFVDRPFQIGDFIETPAVMGSVLEVGVRSTRLREPDGALVSIPNGELANQRVTNHGLRTHRRYATTIGLTYDTPRATMQQFVDGVRTIVDQHPATRQDGHIIYFHEMAESSLNINFLVNFDLVDYGEFLKARQEIFLSIMKLAEELGISFAFPSTSVYIEQTPDQPAST